MYVWLPGTLNMPSETEELNFYFYLIVINLNLSSHKRLVVTILDNAASKHEIEWV